MTTPIAAAMPAKAANIQTLLDIVLQLVNVIRAVMGLISDLTS